MHVLIRAGAHACAHAGALLHVRVHERAGARCSESAPVYLSMCTSPCVDPLSLRRRVYRVRGMRGRRSVSGRQLTEPHVRQHLDALVGRQRERLVVVHDRVGK